MSVKVYERGEVPNFYLYTATHLLDRVPSLYMIIE